MPENPITEMSEKEQAETLKNILLDMQININALRSNVYRADSMWDDFERVYFHRADMELAQATHALGARVNELANSHSKKIEYAKKYLKIGE